MIFADIASGFTEYGARLTYIFQLLSILEIVHALIGLVNSNAATTSIQVFGRLQVLYVHFHIPEARESIGVISMVLAWALVELVRYPYLALKMIKIEPSRLMWLRYSLFFVLYPIGVYGEMRVLYDALPGIETSQFHSVQLPNEWNFTFSFSLYIRMLLLFAYLPGLAGQYMHMMKQRKLALEKVKKII